jgi:UDP-GlcNAc:undecaprenyl-phosphate GlcNAc-1-phosphate transferase
LSPLHGLAALLAAGLAFGLTPLTQRLAFYFGILDRPDGRFKQHGRPVAYLGGLAVYGAFSTTLLVLRPEHAALLPLLGGGGAMLALGAFDDVHPLRWWHKLPLEVLIAAASVSCGLQMQHHLLSDGMSQALSLVWLVAAANALNMLDVADGVASSVALICAAGLAALSGLLSSGSAAVAGMALAGATAGFLPANRPPARQFLGDAGSLSIGFSLAGVALLADYTDQPALAGLAPIGILGVPFLDTILVVVARLRRGASPFVGSNDHLALRLRRRGYSATKVACLGAGLSAVSILLAHSWVVLPHPHSHISLGMSGFFWLATFAWLWGMEVRPVRPSVVRVQNTQQLGPVRDHPLERHHK